MTAITSTSLADAMVGGWQDYQQQLVVVIRGLNSEQLALRVAPGLRSAGEIATHLIAGRVNWFFKILKEQQGDAELAAIAQWERAGQPVRRTQELTRGLEVTWALIQNAISRWTPEEQAELIVLPWIGPKYPITRPWVVWHVLEHDLHHGGELTQTLGLSIPNVKLPPPPPDV